MTKLLDSSPINNKNEYYSKISLNNLPCAAWCKDNKLNYVSVNDKLITVFKINSKSILGVDDYNLPWEKYAESYRTADKEVLTGKSLAILHPVVLGNGNEITIITRKSIIKDASDHAIGVFGLITIVSEKLISTTSKILCNVDSELTSLSCLKNTGQYFLGNDSIEHDLTKRELLCLFYLLRGKTAKGIAHILDLSTRTIEFYIENIKDKFYCKSKSELIEKAIAQGFLNIIPNGVASDAIKEIFK